MPTPLKERCSLCRGLLVANRQGTLAVCPRCDGRTCPQCGMHSSPVVGRQCRPGCKWEATT